MICIARVKREATYSVISHLPLEVREPTYREGLGNGSYLHSYLKCCDTDIKYYISAHDHQIAVFQWYGI